jgi:hypothetical protein
MGKDEEPWATGMPNDNQIALGRAMFQTLGGADPGKKSKVLGGMAEALEMSDWKPLDRALFKERKRKPKQASASPFLSAHVPLRRTGT